MFSSKNYWKGRTPKKFSSEPVCTAATNIRVVNDDDDAFVAEFLGFAHNKRFRVPQGSKLPLFRRSVIHLGISLAGTLSR
jgi:hypothetical protein